MRHRSPREFRGRFERSGVEDQISPGGRNNDAGVELHRTQKEPLCPARMTAERTAVEESGMPKPRAEPNSVGIASGKSTPRFLLSSNFAAAETETAASRRRNRLG